MSSYYEKMLATGEVKCIDEEVPFEVPTSWSWARLTHITYLIEDCPHSTAKDEGKGYPLVRTPNVGFGHLLLNDVHRVSEKVYNQRNTRAVPQKNDLIFAREAPAGNIAVINEEKVCLGQRTVLLRPITHCILPQYLAYYILAPSSQQNLIEKSSGTTVAHVNLSDFRPYMIAVPPIEEQNRIVNKVMDLLPLIEKYSSFDVELARINDEIRNRLKKSVLQEAIQGRLIPQIEEEGTAQELLEQIKAEKQRLVKEGKLKKSAPKDSVIFKGDDNKYYEKIGKKIVCIEDEVPFEIPNSWVWVRLGAIVDFSKSQTISSSMLDMDSWILDLEDIEKDSGRLLQKKRMKDLLSKSDKHLFCKGNVLYSKLRPYLNKVIVADEDGACTTEILAFDFGHIYNKYAQAYLMSPFFVDYANSDSYGIKMPRLGSKRGNNALFPLPPFKEQQRIVAQIEKLFEQLR